MYRVPPNATVVSNCAKNRTLECVAVEIGDNFQFWLTLAFVLLPFVFYYLEMFLYYRIKPFGVSQEIGGNAFLSVCWSTGVWLLWPIRAYFYGFVDRWRSCKSKTVDKLDHERRLHTHEAYSRRAHLIEVATESSLTALLQFYLFLPPYLLSIQEFKMGDILSPRKVAEYLETK